MFFLFFAFLVTKKIVEIIPNQSHFIFKNFIRIRMLIKYVHQFRIQ